MSLYIARAPVAVVIREGGPRLAPGQTRLRAADHADLLEGQQAVAQARQLAERMAAQAAEVSEQARQQGLAQGREEAREELVQAVADLRAMLGGWVRETEPRLVELVLRCVQEIVRSADVNGLVRDSVDRALTEMSSASDIRIQVHESQVDLLRAQTEELMQRHALRGVIRVEAVAALQPGDCVVESPLGVVDLRLASQLKFVQQTLRPD